MPGWKPEQYEFLRNEYLPKLREAVESVEALAEARKRYVDALNHHSELLKQELEVTCHESNVGARTGRTA